MNKMCPLQRMCVCVCVIPFPLTHISAVMYVKQNDRKGLQGRLICLLGQASK